MSRKLVVAEAVLIMLPLSVIAVLGTLWSLRYLVAAIANRRVDLLLLVSGTCVAGLLEVSAGWWLFVSFIHRGRAGLRKQSWLAWFGAAIGAITALTGAALASSGQGVIFATGLFALVPLAHMSHARRRAEG